MECLHQLHNLDQQLISLRSKLDTVPDFKKKQSAIERIKAQEREKTAGLDALRLKKNLVADELDRCRQRMLNVEASLEALKSPVRLQQSTRELNQLKNQVRGLELTENSTKKDTENLSLQLEAIQGKKRILEMELNEIASENRTKDQEITAKEREIETQKTHFQERLPKKYLTLYQKLAMLRGSIALVDATKNSCGGCHMVFAPQFSIELRRSEGIEQCPSCKRILLVPLTE
jgi:predicted  nucleic acid-binding Zn-ribbon protein